MYCPSLNSMLVSHLLSDPAYTCHPYLQSSSWQCPFLISSLSYPRTALVPSASLALVPSAIQRFTFPSNISTLFPLWPLMSSSVFQHARVLSPLSLPASPLQELQWSIWMLPAFPIISMNTYYSVLHHGISYWIFHFVDCTHSLCITYLELMWARWTINNVNKQTNKKLVIFQFILVLCF